ncbi:hypothetical protein [Serratia sp. DD3]|uniref:hypothetical protein n=1 Tax=Serratia sp. DD3 TaxID=1410619 RepID=UPI0004DAA259|nr:hypothetical protein [Serratia sp. DD3]KEY56979.1 hypothetical protein SRDD_42280 [Serratia sp. DD3]
MKKLIGPLIVALLSVIITGCGIKSAGTACPPLQGTYKVEDNGFIYIKKQYVDEYVAAITVAESSPQVLAVMIPKKEDLIRDQLPECSVILKGIGLLAPTNKDKTYNVSDVSQNYSSERKIDTPLVLMVMAGFQSNVYGVVKVSDTLSETALSAFETVNE